MKTSFKSKSKLVFLFIAAAVSASIYSCKKDNATQDTSTITDADAVELATDAIIPTTGGLTTQLNSAVTVYKIGSVSCGAQKDSSITKSSISGATPAYSYNLQWNYLLNCTTNQFTGNYNGASTYDGLRMSSNDNSTGSFAITGLLPATTAYTLNTTYVRNGSQISKIGNNNAFTSKLTITSTNIMVDKSSLSILSGSAAVAISGSSTSGKSFVYNGTLTFLGGQKASLVLNSGASYNIQW